MKSENYNISRYEADEGKVFDWVNPHITEDDEGNEVIEHLYAKTIFIGGQDSIDNYVEIDIPVEE